MVRWTPKPHLVLLLALLEEWYGVLLFFLGFLGFFDRANLKNRSAVQEAEEPLVSFLKPHLSTVRFRTRRTTKEEPLLLFRCLPVCLEQKNTTGSFQEKKTVLLETRRRANEPFFALLEEPFFRKNPLLLWNTPFSLLVLERTTMVRFWNKRRSRKQRFLGFLSGSNKPFFFWDGVFQNKKNNRKQRFLGFFFILGFFEWKKTVCFRTRRTPERQIAAANNRAAALKVCFRRTLLQKKNRSSFLKLHHKRGLLFLNRRTTSSLFLVEYKSVRNEPLFVVIYIRGYIYSWLYRCYIIMSCFVFQKSNLQ